MYPNEHKEGESHEDYEKRTWRERCHVDKDGFVFIPPMAFKKSLDSAAKYAKKKIKGQGQATWTKKFESGVVVEEGLTLPVKKDDIPGHWQPVPPNGVAGDGKRVLKCFPNVPEWEGDVTFYILEDQITESIFTEMLGVSGKFIGVGCWRPERRGMWGRFTVEKVKWEEI